MVIRLDGRIRTCNKGAEQLYGYTVAEVLLLPTYELFPKVERDKLRAILKAISVK